MPETDRQLRQELDEAIDRVRRELEILQAPSSIGGPPDNGSVIAELEDELRRLMQARADL